MSSSEVGRRGDRARAFVPDLIPEPVDIERTGPLDAREQRDLARVHEARDHHGNAQWMRGKALEAAFRRRLYRGEDGEQTRQEYLDAEWDGMSESAAYREIREWPLSQQIAEAYGRPVAGSHVRALVDVADQHGHSAVATAYIELRQYGASTGQPVTGPVVENLAQYLTARTLQTSATPELTGGAIDNGGPMEDLHGLFAPQPLPGPRRRKTPPAPRKDKDWAMSKEQVARLSAWIAAEAEQHGKTAAEVADLLLDALTTTPDAAARPWA